VQIRIDRKKRKRTNDDTIADRWIDGIRLHSPSPSEEHSAEKALERLMGRIEARERTHAGRRRPKRDRRVWLAAATVILLLTVGGYWLLGSVRDTDPAFVVASNNGERARDIVLPDGSAVKLNAHSKLIYPERFGSKHREVFLEGEGFFEVTHDKRHPFIVRAGELNIKVLGTKFDVKADSRDSIITTTLIEGAVRVEHGGESVTMAPGQRVAYDVNTGRMRLTNLADANRDTRWTYGVWTLDDTPLLDVCDRIERLYGVNFVIANEHLLEKSFTGEFHLDEPIDSILRTMRACESLDYEKRGKNIILR
jgi:ferric-dicitrate binding protein FerR (iron transport regulator)